MNTIFTIETIIKLLFMNATKTLITPTSITERIVSLDVLRGVAVLGILIMNVQSFSMIGAAYINPTAYGDLTGINKWVWILSHLLANAKFMSIFSMLFGAGVILFSERALEKGRKVSAFHYRRMMWLLIFGFIHAYLIWYGDILVSYSLCGMLVFVFRRMKPKKLVIFSSLFFVIPIIFYVGSGMSIEYWPQESYDQNMQSWLPSIEKINTDKEAMQGDWLKQMDVRVSSAIFMQTFLFFFASFWRIMSMMLLGMALFKWGVLSAKKSNSSYFKMILYGLIPGLLIIEYGTWKNFQADWIMEYSMFIGNQFNYIGSVGVSLGYIGIVMLICKSIKFKGFKNIFGAVGKMAFTNYILMSLFAMFIFYGNGLGLYGQVERKYQILFVLGIWIILLIISPLWLKRFRFGPLEWLWRVLTYWKKQPFLKN